MKEQEKFRDTKLGKAFDRHGIDKHDLNKYEKMQIEATNKLNKRFDDMKIDLGEALKNDIDYDRFKIKYERTPEEAAEQIAKFERGEGVAVPTPEEQQKKLETAYIVGRGEVNALRNQAKQMQMNLNDIEKNQAKIAEIEKAVAAEKDPKKHERANEQIKRLKNSNEKAHEFLNNSKGKFEQAYKVNFANKENAEVIAKIREQAAKSEQKLKPMQDQIETLQKQQKQAEKDREQEQQKGKNIDDIAM
jgi:small-conductance mechanosensitive channel